MGGYLCDARGHKLSLLTLSAVLLICSHCIIGFADAESRVLPILGLTVFGIAMSLGSAILWPLILLVVDRKYHASALGISSMVDHGLQATSLVIAGLLTKDYTDGQHAGTDQYEYFVYWVLLLAVLMLVLTLCLWYMDPSLNDKPDKQKDADGAELVEMDGGDDGIAN